MKNLCTCFNTGSAVHVCWVLDGGVLSCFALPNVQCLIKVQPHQYVHYNQTLADEPEFFQRILIRFIWKILFFIKLILYNFLLTSKGVSLWASLILNFCRLFLTDSFFLHVKVVWELSQWCSLFLVFVIWESWVQDHKGRHIPREGAGKSVADSCFLSLQITQMWTSSSRKMCSHISTAQRPREWFLLDSNTCSVWRYSALLLCSSPSLSGVESLWGRREWNVHDWLISPFPLIREEPRIWLIALCISDAIVIV